MDEFHSHLEPMKFIRRELIENQVVTSCNIFEYFANAVISQISFSYAKIKDEWNVVKIEGFDEKYDQNR